MTYFNNKQEVIDYLLDNNYVVKDSFMWAGLDISKFLREDLSLNLELLELAIEFLVEIENDFMVFGMDSYLESRGILESEERKKEEIAFIKGFISSVANELAGKEIEVVYDGQ